MTRYNKIKTSTFSTFQIALIVTFNVKKFIGFTKMKTDLIRIYKKNEIYFLIRVFN